MSHVGLGQLMNNKHVAQINQYPSSLLSPVISTLSLALAFFICESYCISSSEGSQRLTFNQTDAFLLQLLFARRGSILNILQSFVKLGFTKYY